MSTPVIQVSGIGKSYDISHQTKMQANYSTLKDDLTGFLKRPLGGRAKGEEHETFWALRDISFEVNQGEIFGIVGKNGSGKSTLLKILSRIVDPTEGQIKMTGRVASLLEVGTGFHPELTGRENIFFNGSMLGMSRQEIKRRFNEIVEFSEIERFLDTPVKFYSSGMYVRLAFSVAAHLESEILILDEVLSVGDASFQQKSLKKITNTIKEGRTVIFVSHSMATVSQLCDKGILLKDGRIEMKGAIQDITKSYLTKVIEVASNEVDESATEVAVKPEMYEAESPKLEFTKVKITNSTSKEKAQVHFKESAEFEIGIKVNEAMEQLRVGVAIRTFEGVMICINHSDEDHALKAMDLKPGKYTFKVKLHNPLLPGKYIIGFGAHEATGNRTSIYAPSLLTVEVLDKDASKKLAPVQEGVVITKAEWEMV